MGLLDIVPAGVITGDNVKKLFDYGKLTWSLQFVLSQYTYFTLLFSSRKGFRYPRHQLYFYQVNFNFYMNCHVTSYSCWETWGKSWVKRRKKNLFE
jgi:hypothetical protein